MRVLLLTTVFLLCFSVGYGQYKIDDVDWRDDGRCGNEFPLSNGLPAKCNPDGGYHCCSEYGYCGSTEEHCNCAKCIDYRRETIGPEISEPEISEVCQNIEVSLKNDVLAYHGSLQGIYTLDDESFDRTWKSSSHAIWYNHDYLYWSIGNLENYGTNVRGITSAGNQSERTPSFVPKWYYMADDWKCSLCDDVIVQCITPETQPPEEYTSDYDTSSECSGIFLNDKGKEKEKPCIFPFKYNGNTYNECTTVDSPNGQPRCARRVTKKGKILNDKWAYCNPGCPGYGY